MKLILLIGTFLLVAAEVATQYRRQFIDLRSLAPSINLQIPQTKECLRAVDVIMPPGTFPWYPDHMVAIADGKVRFFSINPNSIDPFGGDIEEFFPRGKNTMKRGFQQVNSSITLVNGLNDSYIYRPIKEEKRFEVKHIDYQEDHLYVAYPKTHAIGLDTNVGAVYIRPHNKAYEELILINDFGNGTLATVYWWRDLNKPTWSSFNVPYLRPKKSGEKMWTTAAYVPLLNLYMLIGDREFYTFIDEKDMVKVFSSPKEVSMTLPIPQDHQINWKPVCDLIRAPPIPPKPTGKPTLQSTTKEPSRPTATEFPILKKKKESSFPLTPIVIAIVVLLIILGALFALLASRKKKKGEIDLPGDDSNRSELTGEFTRSSLGRGLRSELI